MFKENVDHFWERYHKKWFVLSKCYVGRNIGICEILRKWGSYFKFFKIFFNVDPLFGRSQRDLSRTPARYRYRDRRTDTVTSTPNILKRISSKRPMA